MLGTCDWFIRSALPRLLSQRKPCDSMAMAVIAHLARGIRPVVDLVYPPRCPSCGAAIADQQGLCAVCWAGIEFPPVEAGDDDTAPVFAATLYNDISRKLVLAYKHGGRIALSGLLARMIATRLPEPLSVGALPLLVPVPLHRWRLWRRGFNQAALLAQELGALGKGEVLVDALVRRRRTPSLGGLGREARNLALTGAIAISRNGSGKIAGRDVILIDDVFTSGSTARACITALEHARPASIAIACFARVASD